MMSYVRVKYLIDIVVQNLDFQTFAILSKYFAIIHLFLFYMLTAEFIPNLLVHFFNVICALNGSRFLRIREVKQLFFCTTVNIIFSNYSRQAP